MKARFVFDKEHNQYACLGDWSILNLGNLVQKLAENELPTSQSITVSGKQLTHIDSAGALAIVQCKTILTGKKNKVLFTEFTEQHQALISIIEKHHEALDSKPPIIKKQSMIYKLGQLTVYKLQQTAGLITMVGDVSNKLYHAICQWQRFQWPSIVSNIYSTGIQALPIVGLLSFLIGIVLAYQMGLQLETYGANMFIAYLSGMAVFREFAPLITAIIVAGRTSSAFTAQIGSMKINEEVDALLTMGLSPTELLVLPKVLGLLFIFPLLIFWSDCFGILGAMLASKSMLGISYTEFMARIQDSVGFSQMMLGFYKAPAFAILIALVGCFQGFRVRDNAESLGSQTTKSVVQALFLIIITDAIYSVIYSWKGL